MGDGKSKQTDEITKTKTNERKLKNMWKSLIQLG